MSLFRKKADPREVLKHLVKVTTQAALDDTDEARQKAADHLVADLGGLDRGTLIRTAALAAMLEGDARADQMKQAAKHLAEHLFADLAEHLGQEEPQEPAEEPGAAPEAQEPLDVPEEPSAGDEGPAAGWAEDRR